MTESVNLIHPVQVGRLALVRNLALAPMHKRTHLPFRLLCRRHGAALTHTEMATPRELLGHESRRKAENLALARGREVRLALWAPSPPRSQGDVLRFGASQVLDALR